MKSCPTFWIFGVTAALLVSGCISKPMLSVESDRSPGMPQLSFSDPKGDTPVVVVDGYPWQMSGAELDVYRLPEKAPIRHVAFHENPRLSENSSQGELSDQGPRVAAPFQTERTWLPRLAAGKYLAELKSRDEIVRTVEFEVHPAPRTSEAAVESRSRAGGRATEPRMEQRMLSPASLADLPPWALRQHEFMEQTRADLDALIENSPTLTARLGKIAWISPAGGSSSTTWRNREAGIASMNGSYRCEVHGATRAEIVVVDWVRDSEKAPVRIVRVIGADGTAVSASGG